LTATALLDLILGGCGLFQLWRDRAGTSLQNQAIPNLGIADHVHCAIAAPIAEMTYSAEKMALELAPPVIEFLGKFEH
jgi:hypothetical protein